MSFCANKRNRVACRSRTIAKLTQVLTRMIEHCVVCVMAFIYCNERYLAPKLQAGEDIMPSLVILSIL